MTMTLAEYANQAALARKERIARKLQWEQKRPEREREACERFRDYMRWCHEIELGDDVVIIAAEETGDKESGTLYYLIQIEMPSIAGWVQTKMVNTGSRFVRDEEWTGYLHDGSESTSEELKKVLLWLHDYGGVPADQPHEEVPA